MQSPIHQKDDPFYYYSQKVTWLDVTRIVSHNSGNCSKCSTKWLINDYCHLDLQIYVLFKGVFWNLHLKIISWLSQWRHRKDISDIQCDVNWICTTSLNMRTLASSAIFQHLRDTFLPRSKLKKGFAHEVSSHTYFSLTWPQIIGSTTFLRIVWD